MQKLFSKYAEQIRSFKNPSQYYLYRTKNFKKRLMYAVFFGNAFLIYQSRYNTELHFNFAPTEQNLEIIKNCEKLNKGVYRATFFLFHPLLMSIYGAKIDPTPYIRYEREFVDLKDGGHISLDWTPIHNRYEEDENMRILVICHGLTGGAHSNYMKHAALNGYRFGFRTVCVNLRGIDSPMKNENITDYRSSEDLEQTIDFIQQKYPNANIYGMGISMGANLLTKLAGEQKENCKIKALVSISNPWDVNGCEQVLKSGIGFIYNWNITNNFIRNFKRNYQELKPNLEKHNIDEKSVLNSKNMIDFDEHFTKKLLDIQNITDYYEQSSCKNFIKDVKIPVLAIQANDDPVCPPKLIPKDEIQKNENFILVTTEKGGHIDYFSGYKTKRWVYWPAMEYLNYVDKTIITANQIESVD